MKRSKTPIKLAKNASKLHKHIGELLTSKESIFKFYDIRQEYRVSDINPTYSSNREKFDWIILSPINCVIEVHGQQHYTPQTFGGITLEEAKQKLKDQQERDRLKEQAAREAGWAYISIPWYEYDITLEELTKRITIAIESLTGYIDPDIENSVRVIKIQNNNKLQSRSFNKPPEGFKYKWPKKKLRN